MTQAVAEKSKAQEKAPPKTSAEKEPNPLGFLETTYFFHPEDTLEAAIHRLYVELKYPNSEALVVSELLVPRLTERNHVIVLSRPQMGRYQATRIHRDPMTLQKLSDTVPPEELLHTVHESPAIEVARYIEGASRHRIGKFQSDRFFDELSQHMFGGKLRGQPSENTMRFLIG